MWQSAILFCLLSIIHHSIAGTLNNRYGQYTNLQSVNNFREYLQIDTSNPDNIGKAIAFLSRQASELDLPYAIYEPAGKPIFVATVQGSDPSLPSIMLNSHMDVVKADPTEWTYPPFDAHIDEYGDIYGRGAQDTKDLGIQYLEAVRKLKNENITLARTLHLTYMPDEEKGGQRGMMAFVKTPEFKSLNIGFALDEGMANRGESLYATFVDKRPWQMKFVINGKGGHGYTMPNDSAMQRTYKFMKSVMDFRQTQQDILSTKDSSDINSLGDVTSVNINMVEGGLAENIIPTKIEVVIDMRLATYADVKEMEILVQSWMDIAGNSTEISYIRKITDSAVTSVDATNPYWISMKTTLNNMGIKLTPILCPATSDILVIRNLGIPALGFTTKRRTELRLHAKDEYQNAEIFVKGIDIYKEVIQNLGNLPA